MKSSCAFISSSPHSVSRKARKTSVFAAFPLKGVISFSSPGAKLVVTAPYPLSSTPPSGTRGLSRIKARLTAPSSQSTGRKISGLARRLVFVPSSVVFGGSPRSSSLNLKTIGRPKSARGNCRILCDGARSVVLPVSAVYLRLISSGSGQSVRPWYTVSLRGDCRNRCSLSIKYHHDLRTSSRPPDTLRLAPWYLAFVTLRTPAVTLGK